MSEMPTNPHPNLMWEGRRRLERKQFLKAQHAEALKNAMIMREWVLVKSEVPLWDPTIRHVCGSFLMDGDEFLHLLVAIPDAGYSINRGVPWDWIQELQFFAEKPAPEVLKAQNIELCHGILPRKAPPKEPQTA